MLTDHELTSEYLENYRYAHDFWSPYTSAANVYTKAAAGFTWNTEKLKELFKSGREPLELNIMRRPLQFFSGYLRDNLNSVVIAPVEGSDQKTADQFTKLSHYVWDKADGYSVFLDACDEGFKSGMSLAGIQIDYGKDFINGDISFFNRTFNSYYLDPTFEKLNLRDCGFAITRDLINRSVIKQLLPFVDPKLIDEIQMSFRDDKFLSYHPNLSVISKNKNLLAYDQYYRRTSRLRKFLVDEDNSYFRDITDLDKEDVDKLKTGIYRINKLHDESESLDIDKSTLPSKVEIKEIYRDFIELNIMLNGQHVYTGEDRTGIVESYPFVPILCYMEPSLWQPQMRVQGIPSTQYSIQRQFNKRHMKIVDMMDSSISTGYKYFIGSVPDPQELQQSGQNRIIGIDPENAPAGMDSVTELHGGQANESLINYQGILDQLMLTVTNVNESVIGVDEKGNTQVSGRLAQVRIAQGLRSNRKIIDNVEQSQKILGSLVLKAIQNHYPAGKVKRILGEEPTEQFYEKDFEQYDAVIKEGVRSQSQKDAYYYELIALKREGIVDVPQSEILRALQMSGMSDLEKAIEEQQQQQKQQQQKMAEEERVTLELANSQKEANLALSGVRKARERGEIGLMYERLSEATHNKATAALDRAKAITEIAQMGDERILKVLEFVNMIERQEAEDRNMVVEGASQEAEQIDQSTESNSQQDQQQQQQQQFQQEQQQQVEPNVNQGG